MIIARIIVVRCRNYFTISNNTNGSDTAKFGVDVLAKVRATKIPMKPKKGADNGQTLLTMNT